MNDLIGNDFNFSNHIIFENRKNNKQKIDKLDPKTKTFPSSVTIVNIKEYVQNLNKNNKISDIQQKLLDTFLKRDKTPVYKIGMKEEKCNRQDPYTGQQFIYDYQFVGLEKVLI